MAIRYPVSHVLRISVERTAAVQWGGFLFDLPLRFESFDWSTAQHSCVQRNAFEILLYQTEIRLYLSFSFCMILYLSFGKQTDTYVCILYQSEYDKYNLISVWFNMISKRFLSVSVCRNSELSHCCNEPCKLFDLKNF